MSQPPPRSADLSARFARALTSPSEYEGALLTIAARRASRRRFDATHPEDLSVAEVRTHARVLARRLATDMRKGSYELGPAEPRRIVIGSKERTIHRFATLDLAVLAVLARALRDATGAALADEVYSYVPGRSAMAALRAFERHVAATHRRTGAVYILRADVASYSETVPVHDGAPLWSLVRSSFDDVGLDVADDVARLLATAIRPARTVNGVTTPPPERGLPTGSPIEPWLCNLYLGPVDRALRSVCGSFYARYGDDFVFAHEDVDVVSAARATLAETLASLGLRSNARKERVVYLTRSGRADPAGVAAQGAYVTHLGFAVGCRTGIRLSPEKERRFLSDVEDRVRATARLLGGEPFTDRVQGLCDVVASAVEPGHEHSVHDAESLARHVSDRGQLRDLDRRLALLVASTATGIRGPRAFRRLPPRELRSRYHLPSLVRMRDRGARRHAPVPDVAAR